VGVAVLVLAVMVGLGLYRGWFQFSTNNAGEKSSATITVDKGKIHADEKKAKEEMHGFGQEAKEKTGDRTGKVNEPARQP
jgi:predicted negative regulator of RcsB-dependent stress response